MDIKKRSLIDVVRRKLISNSLIVTFNDKYSNFNIILGNFTNNPFIILTSKILELMQPKKKLFNSTQEAKVWTIFSNLKVDDIPPILKTHEDADHFIGNLLKTKKIPLTSARKDNNVKRITTQRM